jgi:hypothetical protein
MTAKRLPATLDVIRTVETFIVKIAREVPYLGPLRDGEHPNLKGYIVRRGNRTIYPTADMSVLIKVTGESGLVGWGETYGIAAPQATKAIIDEVLGPVMVGRDPGAPVMLHEDLYDLMRVRGACGGYFGDALAGVNIAVWDLFARALTRPLASLLGGCRHPTIPAYVSGLPAATLRERCDLALDAVERGFRAIKIAAVVSDAGVAAEIAALREAVGPGIDLMVDLHWKHTPADAIRLIRRLEPYDIAFAEAPCAPEDVEGQPRWRGPFPPRWRWAKNGTPSTTPGRVSNGTRWASCSPRSATPGLRSSWASGDWRKSPRYRWFRTRPWASAFFSRPACTRVVSPRGGPPRIPALHLRPEPALRHGRHGLRGRRLPDAVRRGPRGRAAPVPVRLRDGVIDVPARGSGLAARCGVRSRPRGPATAAPEGRARS